MRLRKQYIWWAGCGGIADPACHNAATTAMPRKTPTTDTALEREGLARVRTRAIEPLCRDQTPRALRIDR